MPRRAKIVCTLGPASYKPEVLNQLIGAGMDVARLNFSHGSHEDHARMVALVRELAREHGRPVAILQDLQGPKIRVGRFKDGSIMLEDGQEFVITADDVEGDSSRVSTTYKEMPADVRPGDELLVDDGLLRLRVVRVHGPDIHCVVEVGGVLKNNKGINLPTAAVSAPSMTEKDKEDLLFGLELHVDYMALSFVRSALDIHQMRAMMPRTSPPIHVISKIEKPQALADLDAILAVSDGIMVARGDLGVEMPPQKVPMIQKMLIQRANAMGRITITATQMLESMTENPRPTRAEASDVANAVLDGSDAVMLSGETASGKYPVRAVEMMAAIISEVESSRQRDGKRPDFIQDLNTFPNAVARAATTAADELHVKAIVVLTQTGATARLVMTYRPDTPIIACTPTARVTQQMAAYWGVQPFRMESMTHSHGQTTQTDTMIGHVEELLLGQGLARRGDEIIVIMGAPMTERSETNLIKFHRLGG